MPVKLSSSGYRHFVSREGYVHDDVLTWNYFPCYWPFVLGIHRSPVNSPHKGQWRGALMFSLICAWIHSLVNNDEAGNLRRHRAHYDVTVMLPLLTTCIAGPPVAIILTMWNDDVQVLDVQVLNWRWTTANWDVSVPLMIEKYKWIFVPSKSVEHIRG